MHDPDPDHDAAPGAMATVLLDGRLTVRGAEAVCARLRAAVAPGRIVRVDCSAAEEADLSVVQLLLAARLAARRDGGDVVLAGLPAGPLGAVLAAGGFRVTPEAGRGFWFEGDQA